MNDAVFGTSYAASYDEVYAEKDYEAECDLVERILREHSPRATSSILDLGCGTGSHAAVLARRGYTVTGVDRSADMLARARVKAPELDLVEGDIRTIRLGRRFDAVVMLFAVLGYMTSNDDVVSALRTAGEHLASDGTLVFDVWYGPAVLCQRPAQRFREIGDRERSLLRLSEGSLDVRRQLSMVDFRFWHLEGDRLASETREHHVMRFFFPLELELLLALADLELVRLSAFPEADAEPDEATWNVLVVARPKLSEQKT